MRAVARAVDHISGLKPAKLTSENAITLRGYAMTDQQPGAPLRALEDMESRPAVVLPPLARMPYAAPRLVTIGDLRDLTLGGSVGRADSGAPSRQARVGGI